jgi:hypothetical protein
MWLLPRGLGVATVVSVGLVAFPLIRRSPTSETEAVLFGVGLLILLSLAVVGGDRICGYFCAEKGDRGPFWLTPDTRRLKTIDLSELEADAAKARQQGDGRREK